MKYTVICRLVRLEESRSLTVTLIVNKYDLEIQKGANRLFRKSNIISDVGFNQPNILGEWSYSHNGYSVILSHDFRSNRFRKSEKCCPLWTTVHYVHLLQLLVTVVILWHNSAGIYHGWTDLSRSKCDGFHLFAHKWSKDLWFHKISPLSKFHFLKLDKWPPKIQILDFWRCILCISEIWSENGLKGLL